jgi:hypothetical protein
MLRCTQMFGIPQLSDRWGSSQCSDVTVACWVGLDNGFASGTCGGGLDLLSTLNLVSREWRNVEHTMTNFLPGSIMWPKHIIS